MSTYPVTSETILQFRRPHRPKLQMCIACLNGDHCRCTDQLNGISRGEKCSCICNEKEFWKELPRAG